jgi:predicted dehydrogenase
MVAEDMHFRPVLWEAARRISNGDIGEPLYLMAFAGGVRRPSGWAADKNQMGGGVLMDIGVHYVRGMRVLFGEPDRVFASKAMQINTKISGEDSVQLLFGGRTGWEAHMVLSWASTRGQFPDFVLMGDKGTIHLWPGKTFLDYYPVAPGFLMRAIPYVRPYWLQQKLLHPNLQRQRIKLRGREGTGYEKEFREFCAAVIEKRPPASSAEEGRRDLEIVLCGYEALKSRVWVDIAGHL